MGWDGIHHEAIQQRPTKTELEQHLTTLLQSMQVEPGRTHREIMNTCGEMGLANWDWRVTTYC